MTNPNTPITPDVVLGDTISKQTFKLPQRAQPPLDSRAASAPFVPPQNTSTTQARQRPRVQLEEVDEQSTQQERVHTQHQNTQTRFAAPAINSQTVHLDGQQPQAELSPEFQSVDLPSNFFFYPFKQLSVKPVLGIHQAKFNAAYKSSSLKMTTETISSLLSDNVSAFDLTVNDFYYILYYLRINCYSKVPYSHRWTCNNASHVLAVSEGKKHKDTLKNMDIVSRTTLKETLFKPEPLQELDLSGIYDLGYDVGPPLQRDAVALSEFFDRPDYMEIEYLSDFASCLRLPNNPQSTLAERIQIVGNLPPDALSILDKFLKASTDYGVDELINVKCKECGAEMTSSVEISASAFSG